jgi:epoxyqueuosine reductase
MSTQQLRDDILLLARELGFDLAAVAPAQLPPPHENAFAEWIANGHAADMNYLGKRLENGVTLEDLLPHTRSLITLAVNYWRPNQPSNAPGTGKISQYAVTRDYHKTIKAQLKKFVATIQADYNATARGFVDVGPILERAYAATASIGYQARNAMIITPEFGSWVFLAVVLTDLELPPSSRPIKQRCGQCVRCIDACPTDAIIADQVIDSSRCISYLTIENKGPIPLELRPLMGNWIFGCDDCQTVCPHNSRAQTSSVDDFLNVRFPDGELSLAELLAIRSDRDFLALFAGTPMMRAKRTGMLRNAAVAAGNSGDASLIPVLEDTIANDASDLIREHAQWALKQLK